MSRIYLILRKAEKKKTKEKNTHYQLQLSTEFEWSTYGEHKTFFVIKLFAITAEPLQPFIINWVLSMIKVHFNP